MSRGTSGTSGTDGTSGIGNKGSSGTSGHSGSSGTSGTSGLSGTSGKSGIAGTRGIKAEKTGTSGTGGIPWGNKNSTWEHSPPSFHLTSSWTPILETYSSYSGSSFTISNYDSNLALTSLKKKSMALNVNDMKGIDLRKAIKSKTVSACEIVT